RAEHADAMPFGFRRLFVVGVLPRTLRRDGQNGELRAVVVPRLTLLRVCADKADDRQRVEIRHEFFSFFLPHFPGAPRSERPLLPRRAGALWEGPVPFGGHRESRTREAARRRNWPEAVPRKMNGRRRLGY